MRRSAVWALFGLTVAAVVARIVLKLADPVPGDGDDALGGGVVLALFDGAFLLAFTALGTVVALRRPQNPVAWVLCGFPVFLGLLLFGHHLFESLVEVHGRETLGVELVGWVLNWIWIPFILPVLTFLPLLFPSGHLLTQRWRPVGLAAAGGAVASFVGIGFAPGRLEDPDVDNPFGIGGVPGTIVEIIGGVGFALMVIAALGAAASLVLRFRRSSGDERQQLKWVAAAAALFLVVFLVPTEPLIGDDVAFATLLLGLGLVEGAVVIAMLRYRLYDIDVVINRALVYGALTGLLAGAYLGSVLLLQLVLSPSSDLAIAGSTLAVAALFRPARARIQALVDRRFFRRRYDAQQTLEAFSTRLRDEVSIDALSLELRTVIGATVQPDRVSLWMRP